MTSTSLWVMYKCIYIYTVTFIFQEKGSKEPLGPEMEQCAWYLTVLTWVSEQMKK